MQQKTGGTSFLQARYFSLSSRRLVSPYPLPPIPNPCLSASSQVTCNEISRRPSLFHSIAYKMLFPQPLCFDVHAFFMGSVHGSVHPLSAQSSRRASRGECEE